MPEIEEPFQTIINGDRPRLRFLLSKDPSLASARNANGESALLVAAYRAHRDIVELLIDHGAQPDVFEAASLGDAKSVEAMLKIDPALCRSFSSDGWTALHLAAHLDRHAVADVLLKAGADISAPSGPASLAPGSTPLHAAVAAGHYWMAAFLLDHGADVNATQTDGATPLHVSAAQFSADLVHLLLDRGADVRLTDSQARSPLDVALAGGKDAAAHALQSRKAAKPEVDDPPSAS